LQDAIAKHCLVLMPAYKKYHLVDVTLLASCWSSHRFTNCAGMCSF